MFILAYLTIKKYRNDENFHIYFTILNRLFICISFPSIKFKWVYNKILGSLMVLITIRFTRMHGGVRFVPLTPGIISYCRYYLKFLRDQRGVGEMKTGHVKMLSLLFTRRQRQFRRCGVL